MSNLTREQYETLLMTAVDGLASDADMQRLEHWWLEHPEDRAEYDDFVGIKRSTDGLRDRILADADIQSPRESAPQRNVIGLATGLLALGALIWMVFTGWLFFSASDVPVPLKIAGGLGSIGALIFFGIALRTRLRALGRDPYSEIDQ